MAAHRDGGERNERPTPERRREARRAGQVAISADLTAAAGLAAALGVFAVAAPAGAGHLVRYLRGALGQAVASASGAGHPDAAAAMVQAGAEAVAVGARLVAIPALAALAAALVFGGLQTGGLVAWSATRPSLARVSPGAGLRRLFGAATAGAAGRLMVKVVLVAGLAATVLAPLVRALPGLARARPGTILGAIGALCLSLAARLILALVVWGLVDWGLARWRHERELAMTRGEIKREHREREGDPVHRAERRRLHRALTEEATPAEARTATFVVVTGGPVPAAAAVAYDPASGRAPIVVVAGRHAVAERIQGEARQAAVPVHVDAALAEALVDVPAAAEIPATCFEAVAALLP